MGAPLHKYSKFIKKFSILKLVHREDILEKLRVYLNRWPGEGEVVRRYVPFVEENEACFERFLSVGYVSGSAWLVNREGTHVLLTLMFSLLII